MAIIKGTDTKATETFDIQTKQADANKKKSALGQDDFLKLMMAQIKGQSPLNPQDNAEFLGQMAQFSTVSGLQEMQKSLDSLATSMTSNQALQASSMVGRHVLVAGNTGYLPEGEGNRYYGAADLPVSTGNLQITITNERDVPVKKIGLGHQEQGLVRFAWDGLDESGKAVKPGVYKVKAEIYNANKLEAVETMVAGSVESVTLGRNGQKMMLNVAGLGPMGMDAVREILN